MPASRTAGNLADAEFVPFLRAALEHLQLEWAGFRRVRGQVRKRLARRMAALGLTDLAAYRSRLAAHPEEWGELDAMCRITISRFWRDRGLFEYLAHEAPALLANAGGTLRVWSAGCANGEEPYSIVLLWRLLLEPRYPGCRMTILATDADGAQIQRARRGCYEAASLRELPPGWREAAFTQRGPVFELRPEFRAAVEFREGDIRREMPAEVFDVVFCRNVAFLYFEESVARRVAEGIRARMRPGSLLVVGRHERLPAGMGGFADAAPGVYSAV